MSIGFKLYVHTSCTVPRDGETSFKVLKSVPGTVGTCTSQGAPTTPPPRPRNRSTPSSFPLPSRALPCSLQTRATCMNEKRKLWHATVSPLDRLCRASRAALRSGIPEAMHPQTPRDSVLVIFIKPKLMDCVDRGDGNRSRNGLSLPESKHVIPVSRGPLPSIRYLTRRNA